MIQHGGHEVIALAINDCIHAVGNICTHDEVFIEVP